MNPMSLLTFPADALREVAIHSDLASPRGEGGESGSRAAIVLLTLAALLALVSSWSV